MKDVSPEIYAQDIFIARKEGYDAIKLNGVKIQRGNVERLKAVRKEIAEIKPKLDILEDQMLSGKITQNEYDNNKLLKKFQELLKEESPTHTIVFNTDVIQTESQLTDIWNNANKTEQISTKSKELSEILKRTNRRYF